MEFGTRNAFFKRFYDFTRDYHTEHFPSYCHRLRSKGWIDEGLTKSAFEPIIENVEASIVEHVRCTRRSTTYVR